ncbi:MAG: C45 family autoproteolytic acyltransferase/hydrolase [Bacteroidetes bacterium]|nr:C45 family autoproteolytic acyltransferase/hydrolase [Bacteroidota bacterium]
MKKLLKWTAISLLFIVVVLAGFFLYIDSIFSNEAGKHVYKKYVIDQADTRTTRIGNNWLRKERPGLYTLYIEGKPFDRGLIAGQLTRGLIFKQEKAFVDQIKKMVPSRHYLNFLKYVIAIFDLNLYHAIPEERKAEIYGISCSASGAFSYIASNYQRILNYHGAHDLGHMLSNMGMVGCTSFGVWNDKTANGNLMIGRNFDFYVGDEFAREKIVAFIRPDSGYFHAFVTWGAMMGATSGMNEKGLTVTINAANSDVVFKAATPVSLVARQILQYASNIREATLIASKFDVFVSELFLVGSAADNKAVIIEKRPGSQIVYEVNDNYIISTNHFQSVQNGFSVKAKEQRLNTASGYRFGRVHECINASKQFNVADVAAILRDTAGCGGASIGLGNEKAINQLIGHHSVIFYPKERKFWVSTAPYQLGGFVCYDLEKMGKQKGVPAGTASVVDSLYIEPEAAFLAKAYPRFQQYRELRMKLAMHTIDDKGVALMITLNPAFFEAYEQAGDYYAGKKQPARAAAYYTHALACVIPGEKEVTRIRKKRAECGK